MTFNEKLKNYRTDHGYTQEQFASLTGFSRSTITELESGRKKATLKTIEKIANKTNTNLSIWLSNECDHEINLFDGLKMVLEALIETGNIDSNGEMNDEAKKLTMKMLEKEAKLMVYNKKRD